MLKQEKEPINIVDIDSSDDEDGVGGGKGKNTSSSLQGRPQVQSNLANPLLASRSFWKAGNYDVGPTKSVPAQGQLEHARVHPKFLHSNATSHKWAFGDGNGFKTSTMRLGADVVVFSRASKKGLATQSVGLLSYTFLRRTGQDDVIVPMVDFKISNHWAEPIIYSSEDDWSTNLKTILEWSPFASKAELMLQFEDIGLHGTKIIIYNLWLNDEGIFELSFDDDDEDIRLRDEANRGSFSKTHKRVLELQSHISYRIRYSLRAYASILYLRKFTNFQIILRGTPVEQFNIADELKYPKVVMYRPQLAMTSKEVSVETTIGFIKEAPALGVSGFNVYHKNRLIRPFWKVTIDGNSQGNGVVGVLEANFMEPAHDKQDFERSPLFIRLEMRLKKIVLEYWRAHCHLVGHQPYDRSLHNMQKKSSVQPPVRNMANAGKQLSSSHHIIGLSGNAQKEMWRDQPIIGLAANFGQELSGTQPVNHSRTSSHNGLPAAQPILDLPAEVASVDSSRTTSIDQICEENIQLFMRCEEHIQKENELKQMIQALEKQLEETKRKSAQLAAHLENRKKQNLLQQMEKS